jgi:spore photoproduct lyase
MYCYLLGTFRAVRPFITIRVEYPKIQKQIRKRLSKGDGPILFNMGELADSLSMEHLNRAGQEFIPFFGEHDEAYLFMLTKSDNIDPILDLDHKGHTILTWSLNAPEVSRRFEIGAPPFERRLAAARKAQQAGYRIRLRVDPIIPISGWREAYAATVKEIFRQIRPERITLGTLRFEESIFRNRHSFFPPGSPILKQVERMTPMFQPMVFPGSKRPKIGKYSFPLKTRYLLFAALITEIRKYSDCPVALCKESSRLWKLLLPLKRCRCVCQLESVDMSRR